MNVLFIKVLILICTLQYINGQTDYCDLCPDHIACNNTGTFSSKCPANAVIVNLSDSDKDLFVSVHNELRNKIAGGLLPGFSTASDMFAVVWDPKLAYFAELNVMQCEMRHDGCRNTENFPFAGQNIIARSSNYPQYPAVSATIRGFINAWFNEYKAANQTQMTNCCQGSGHFTQVVQSRVVAIGCALARYGYTWKNDLMVCNYSFTNLINSPVYNAGPTASDCPDGTHEVYTNLCQ
ncbi:antigen 5 like allergen Cul n 1-like [Chironomus tepperi]|uniref:antigen 5 like allergen Cul n 1-like n=1 Tax=Chironomus tepperi TaxID=113505 RepID=UPI00391FA6BD